MDELVTMEIRRWFDWGASKVAGATGSVIAVQAWLGDSTPEAAMVYCDQVRGTTRGTAELVIQQLTKEGR